MDFLTIAIALPVLLLGGELLVRGGAGLATRLGLSPAVIGVAVLGVGTSMPELVTSVRAGLAGSPGIALGNVVGSNIANVLLILGVGALLSRAGTRWIGLASRVDVWAFAASALVLAAVVGAGTAGAGLGRVAGAALLFALAAYLWVTLRWPDASPAPDLAGLSLPPLGRSLALLGGGLVLTILGADRLVSASISLAASFGVSEALIGLTIVAVGTSLPELVTTLIAARKGESGLALGNVLGSNVFNAFGILGVTALVSPLPPAAGIGWPEMLAVAASTLAVLAILRVGVPLRVVGLGFIAGYVTYLLALAG